jgi:flagellar basal body-associated protein FliL
MDLIANVPSTISKELAVPDLIWIIIVVLVVLALLGYFGRGRFGG